MEYRDLLNDLALEVGDRPDVVSRLPLFIKMTEDYLWPRMEGFATTEATTVTVTADSTEATITDDYWMRILGVFDEDGEAVKRVSYHRLTKLNLEDEADDCEYFAWKQDGTLYVATAPDDDTELTVVHLDRDAPLGMTSSSTDSFFLNEGYNLLKYGVLTMRVFDPDKWPAWKQQYDRELHAMFVRSQKQALTYKGDDGRRWL